jgi:AcrR family transcriptional regulator
MTGSDPERTYAGATAEQRRAERRGRLIAAGVALLGAGPEDGGGLTVRGVCTEAGLTPRYFYESFTSTDELAAAVFETVIGDAAEVVGDALAGAEPEARSRSRATVEAFVSFAVDDPRRARILFVEGAAESLREQRAAALRTFAELAAAQGRELYGAPPGSERLVEAASYLIAGGMAELLLAWIRGEVKSSRVELIEDAVDLLGAVGEAAARVARGRGAEPATAEGTPTA